MAKTRYKFRVPDIVTSFCEDLQKLSMRVEIWTLTRSTLLKESRQTCWGIQTAWPSSKESSAPAIVEKAVSTQLLSHPIHLALQVMNKGASQEERGTDAKELR
jgi:hypothetical protein